MSKHWTQFWQQGHLTTFGAALPANYEGVIAEFWQAQFARLPAQAALLDVATGNGAVALLAADYAEAEGRDWVISGCDAAQIVTRDSRVRFYSGVRCEQLPLPDASVDLVTSQYGFEYADTRASLLDFHRVLKPGGRFTALCHHADSYTLENSRQERTLYHRALDELQLFDSAAAYLETRDAAAGQRLNEGVNALRAEFPDNPACAQLLGAFSGTLRGGNQKPLAELVAALQQMNEDFRGASQRLDDLMAAASDEASMAALAGQARAAGFAEAVVEVIEHEPGTIAGFALQCRV